VRSGKNLLWLVIFASWCFSATSRAETAPDGDSLAASGDWPKAAAAYEASWRSGSAPSTSAFYYNFGTTSLRAGNPGAARALLWKARFLAPLDSDIRDNLLLAEGRLSGAVSPLRPATWFDWWPGSLRVIGWPWLLAATLAAFAPALWLFGRESSAENSPSRWVALAVGVLFAAALGISLLEKRYPAAGVVAPAKLLSGPAASFPPIGTLEPGTLVNVEEDRENWRKLRFTNAKLQEVVGWSESHNLLELR
jgi:hypothetical protein